MYSDPWRAPPPIDPWSTPPPTLSPMALVQRITAEVYGVPVEAMTSHWRGRQWAWPRQAAMALCYELVSGASLPRVGRAFRRDHTTIVHALQVRARRLDDPEFAAWSDQYREAERRCRLALNRPVNNRRETEKNYACNGQAQG